MGNQRDDAMASVRNAGSDAYLERVLALLRRRRERIL